MKTLLPPLSAVGNPVDTTAGYPRPEHEADYRAAFEAILGDPAVHQLCVLFGTIMGRTFELSARVLSDAAAKSDKPVFAFSAVPREISSQGHEHLERAGIPLFSSLTRAASTLGLLADYAEARRYGGSSIVPDPVGALPVLSTLPAGACMLDEHESKQVLAAAGIPVTRDIRLALDPDAESLQRLVFPVALKLVSRDIPHKSDVGAVKLNISSPAELARAAAEIIAAAREAAPSATLSGLLACAMVSDGVETIVGVINDESFGPVVAFGLGGVLAETLKDVTYRVAPFGEEDAYRMIAELNGSAVLQGVRGRPPCDLTALAQTLARVSALAWALRDRIAELDINPLLVRPAGCGVVAADALLVLR